MFQKLGFYKQKANILEFYIIKNFYINITFFFLLFHIVLNECNRNAPIKLNNGSCVMKYCTKEEYESEECILDNSIIKTQFLNNLMNLGEMSFRYFNFVQFSNGDLILETSPFPPNNKRIFFGLKKNGRYYFKNDNNEETPFNYLIADNIFESKYESGNSIIINDGKEYFLSIGRLETFTELFDFENNKIISNKTEDLIGYYNLNLRSNLLKINKEENTYIFPCISDINDKRYAILLKFDLELKENGGFSFSDCTKREEENIYGEIASCFVTEKNRIIICFYAYKNGEFISYLLIAYDKEFNQLVKDYFIPPGLNINAFFYSIFFRGDSGAFIFYNNQTKEVAYPNIKFIKYDVEEGKFKEYFSDNNLIVLNEYIFNYGSLINDLIKISDNKLGFFTSSSNLETLYIIILNIFNKDNINNIKIRYYSIENYKLLNFKLSQDIKAYIFNDFIILGASYCLVSNCINADWYKYSNKIMIIGYPNKDDEYFDIIKYLILDNNNSIENITLDLSANITIENNVFGYIYDGIKIQSIESNDYIYLVSSTSNNTINNETNNELGKNEEIKINFKDNMYKKSECLIEYSIIVTEPEYKVFEKYTINNSTIYGDDNEEIFNAQKHKYIGKSIYYNIILSENLSNKCNNLSCALCFEKNISCITYRPYIEIITESIEIDINTNIETEFMITEINNETGLINNKSNNFSCSNQDIFRNKCQNETLSDKQLEYFYQKLKDEIKNNITNNTEITIKTQNAILQLLSLKEKISEDDNDISTIDLGKCFDILKESIHNPLKILKVDIKSDDLASTYVQYEIYDSLTGDKINLTICNEVTIKIKVKQKIGEETKNIINNLENSGYNYLDKNDSFYNDICSTYTSQNGKDVLLSDRYNDIYVHISEMYICQTGCQLTSYNTETERAECDCKIQKESITTNLKDISFSKDEIIDAFLGALKNSNFIVLKCYKLLLDFSKLILNYGFIIMSVILFSDFILILIYIIMRRNKITEIIKYFIKIKFQAEGINKNQKNNKTQIYQDTAKKQKNIKYDDKKNKNIFSRNKTEAKRKRSTKKPPKKSNNKNRNNEKVQNKKKNLKKENNFPPKKKNNIKNIKINNNIFNINIKDSISSSMREMKFPKKALINKRNKIVVHNKNNYNCSESLKRLKRNNAKYKDDIKEKDLKKNKNVPKFNDQEINFMEYKNAVKIDRRTYFQYYFSLLKRRQLILFAFFPNNDYNIIELKISLLLLSFSLYFTINGFFFSDETMHKIYKDNSSYNIVYQISIMAYSTLISSVLNMILKQLSLSENNVLSIAQSKEYKSAVKKSKTILKCLRIKIFLFFLLRIIILLFCWYYISCFCAVYINTQITLISDTFISYGLSMIYPFGLNLIPGIFRIPALRAKNKDKKCLYKISNILSLFL